MNDWNLNGLADYVYLYCKATVLLKLRLQHIFSPGPVPINLEVSAFCCLILRLDLLSTTTVRLMPKKESREKYGFEDPV